MLSSCGDDIDIAIKRLGELRLTANCQAEQPQAHSTPPPSAAAPPSAQSGDDTLHATHKNADLQARFLCSGHFWSGLLSVLRDLQGLRARRSPQHCQRSSSGQA